MYKYIHNNWPRKQWYPGDTQERHFNSSVSSTADSLRLALCYKQQSITVVHVNGIVFKGTRTSLLPSECWVGDKGEPLPNSFPDPVLPLRREVLVPGIDINSSSLRFHLEDWACPPRDVEAHAEAVWARSTAIRPTFTTCRFMVTLKSTGTGSCEKSRWGPSSQSDLHP